MFILRRKVEFVKERKWTLAFYIDIISASKRGSAILALRNSFFVWIILLGKTVNNDE